MPGKRSKAQRTARKRAARKVAARESAAKAEYATQANVSQQKPEGELPETGSKMPLASVQSEWDVSGVETRLLTFENAPRKNLEVCFIGTPSITYLQSTPFEDNEVRRSTMTKNSLPLGHPDAPVEKPAERSIFQPIHSDYKRLKEALNNHPHVQFLGMSMDALSQIVDCIFDVTNEVTLKWVRKWCPTMKLSRVFSLASCSRRVPDEALEMSITLKTLPELYADCREAFQLHGNNPQACDVAPVANPCIILCQVFKDKKTANLIWDLNQLVQWFRYGLELKAFEVQRKAMIQICLGTKKESEILEFAWSTYNIYRAEYSIRALKRMKALLDHAWPADEDHVLYPGESESEHSDSDAYDYWDKDMEDSSDDEPEEVEVFVISDSE
ncbi:uncharacterized protein GGS22DRAFT_196688 [Annulohypoxylon maeteangense]|uniref:uncharacterized protein n=1 Tax=Annulohypoxylon maeteangense TaxID=1927788 RepID=UPI0020078820|nr:uncharacterized protein GGS22DRAFT_196688 [Annulohypoxylon maeteangense]KAI0888895.1 hypothetical protein GGS22DRAFT_196688 [Annulohypoxylon maeteangense]